MLRSPNMRKQAELYALTHGFNIEVTLSHYITTHPRIDRFRSKCKTYGDALRAMENIVKARVIPTDGGNPEAIEKAAKDAVHLPHGWLGWMQPVESSGDTAHASIDKTTGNIGIVFNVWHVPTTNRQFRVTVRFKGGERRSYVCDNRDEAFESAGAQLTNKLVKSVKLEPM